MNSACQAITGKTYHYQLAGRHWISQRPIRYLQAFAVPEASEAGQSRDHTTVIHFDKPDMLRQQLTPVDNPCYSAPTRLALCDYHLQAWWPSPMHCCVEAQYCSSKSWISIPPFVQKFDITSTHITCQGNESLLPASAQQEHWVDEAGLLLGPVMACHLAMHGIFLLHASAIVMDDTLCVFLAPSGSGKSTLAAEWHDVTDARVADDILPVRLKKTPTGRPGGLEVLPQFPQLKLDKPAQWKPDWTATWQRLHWFFLQPLPAADRPEKIIEPIGRQQTLLNLGQHSVATQLFPAPLMGQHLQFCQEASAQPGAVLHYPHCPGQVDAVFEALAAYLQERF